MAEIHAGTRFIEKEVGGQPVKFARPTWRHRLAMQSRAKLFFKEQLADNLNLARVDEESVIQQLAEFDANWPTPEWFNQFINTDPGLYYALELSLSDYEDAEAIADQVEDPQAIVMELWGLKLIPKTKPPDPTGPAPTPAKPTAKIPLCFDQGSQPSPPETTPEPIASNELKVNVG